MAQRDDPRQQPDQDVRVDAPLVGLVYDDDAVLVQKEVLGMGGGGSTSIERPSRQFG